MRVPATVVDDVGDPADRAVRVELGELNTHNRLRWAALPGGESRPRSPSGLGARIGGGDLLGAPPSAHPCSRMIRVWHRNCLSVATATRLGREPHSHITEASDAWQPGSASTVSAGSAATSFAPSRHSALTSR